MSARAAVGLSLGAFLLSVAGAELLVRLCAPQAVGVAPAMYVADSLLIHALSPGYSGVLRSGEYTTHVALNERGFRGPSWRAEARRRVLVLGDSFTFGYGVEYEQAYPAVTERMLAQAGCSAAVFNAGVPGYGTMQEWELARRLIPRTMPQAVVLGFTVGSDLTDNLEQGLRPESGYEVRNGFLVQKGTPAGTPLPLKAWFQEHSHLYVLLQRARVRAALRGARGPRNRRACEHFMAAEPCGDLAKAWDLTVESLRGIDAACEEAGAHLVVLIIPHPVQVDEELWRRERARFGGEELDRFGVNRTVAALCEALEARCVDPLSRLREGPPRRLFYRLDRHLTVEGHGRVAEALAAELLTLFECTEGGSSCDGGRPLPPG